MPLLCSTSASDFPSLYMAMDASRSSRRILFTTLSSPGLGLGNPPHTSSNFLRTSIATLLRR